MAGAVAALGAQQRRFCSSSDAPGQLSGHPRSALERRLGANYGVLSRGLDEHVYSAPVPTQWLLGFYKYATHATIVR